MKINIVPAILPKSFDDLKSHVEQVRGLVSRVQIDIANGSYAPTYTWPYTTDEHFDALVSQKEGFPFWEDIEYEIDMLVEKPEQYADAWISAGASTLIVHVETLTKKMTKSFFENCRTRNVSIGLALKPSTSNDSLSQYIDKATFVQCMGSDRIGYHGVELDNRVYDKIKNIRTQFSHIPIAVDIGVNKMTAEKLIDIGATKLVSGSAIFNAENIHECIRGMQNIKNMP